MTTETPMQTPLLDLLKSVPEDGRHVYEHDSMHSHNIPYGRLCREAADELERLRAQVAQYKEDAERLHYVLRRLPGSIIRALIGVMSDTGDIHEFRAAIDKARKTT